MNWRKNIDIIYDFVSKSLIICYFAFLASIVFFISLDLMPIETEILKYGEIFASIVLIGVTIIFSYENNKMIKQTKLSQDRSLKISYIQNRLEKFYYPLLYILEIITTETENKLNPNSVKTSSIRNWDQYDWVVSKLDELIKYQHFAFPESKKIFNEFRQIMNNYHNDDVEDDYIIFARSITIGSVDADIKILELELYEKIM